MDTALVWPNGIFAYEHRLCKSGSEEHISQHINLLQALAWYGDHAHLLYHRPKAILEVHSI